MKQQGYDWGVYALLNFSHASETVNVTFLVYSRIPIGLNVLYVTLFGITGTLDGIGRP